MQKNFAKVFQEHAQAEKNFLSTAAASGQLIAGCCSTLNLAHLPLRGRFHLLTHALVGE
jgi:hypothetical protein